MSPIAKALRRQTRAERLDADLYVCAWPEVARDYSMLMLRIAVRLACGVEPAPIHVSARGSD